MASGIIKITPTELLAQASEMNALQEQYLDLFGNVNSELNKVNSNWSTNLAHNFCRKITGSSQTFLQITRELANGAKVAKSSAETFETVDSQLAKLYEDDGSTKKPYNEATMSEIPDPVDMDFYLRNVTDAEYALLCHYWSQAAQSNNPLEDFWNRLQDLPENDPIRELAFSQMSCVNSSTGFSAITIKDGNGNAMVIFAGTNGDAADLFADAEVAIGSNTIQSQEAIDLVNRLSKECDNIVVTGHSLGGYLATAVTLKNKSVSNCIAFDPPGRYDAWYQNTFRDQYASKVTTYVADGSLINKVGFRVGSVNHVPIPKELENGGALSHNHGIKQISDALGGVSEKSWNLTCPVER